MENVARGLSDAAAEQTRLRGVTREIADFAATQIEGHHRGGAWRRAATLGGVQASLHDSIAGEAVLASATRRKRGSSSAESSVPSSNRAWREPWQRRKNEMDGWLKGALDGAIRKRQDALAAATLDFRVKLFGGMELLGVERLRRGHSGWGFGLSLPGLLDGETPMSTCFCLSKNEISRSLANAP